LLYFFIAIFADFIAPYGQAEVLDRANIPPGADPRYLLGTDQIGRDILTRLIYGAQNTVGIAFITTILAFLLGTTFGFLAATLGGWLDQVISRVVDVMMAIPQLIFALLILTIVGQSTTNLVLVIAVLESTRVFRLARAVGLNIVVMDYVEAARLRGEGLAHIILREMLPNATAPLLAEFGLRFCFVFLLIAALSFLGLGIQPPLADWGSMVSQLARFIAFAQFDMLSATLPLMAAGAIALLTVAVNFVVDWALHQASGLKE
ncbi:MAG TPA: ABC transporter permease, partial [Paracoccaceae bacterium]|nr:ABC transporter permease [Paracoccaceae bacterium]